MEVERTAPAESCPPRSLARTDRTQARAVPSWVLFAAAVALASILFGVGIRAFAGFDRDVWVSELDEEEQPLEKPGFERKRLNREELMNPKWSAPPRSPSKLNGVIAWEKRKRGRASAKGESQRERELQFGQSPTPHKPDLEKPERPPAVEKKGGVTIFRNPLLRD